MTLSIILNVLLAIILTTAIVYIKALHAKDASRKKYRNLYIGQGNNNYVYGLNEYLTAEEAEENQQCPPGFRWYAAIPSREWA